MMPSRDRPHAVRARPLGGDDLLQPHDGRLEIVVDDDVVVVGVARRLVARGAPGAAASALRCPCCGRAAAARAPGTTAACTKIAVWSTPRAFTCRAPLHVDHQHDVLPVGEHAARRPPRPCRSSCRTRRPTRETRCSAISASNSVAADEIIVDAVALAGARRPRRVRPRHPQIRQHLHQPLDERRLARARRRRDDEQQPARGYSTF